jgi:hypothetical protein
VPTNRETDRTSYYCDTEMALKQIHKHTAVTTVAIRQRSGVPYQVERKVCASCRTLLEEKPVKRAAAA